MPHLNFVAMREPVTCELPTDPPGHKRLIRQFHRLELEKFDQAEERRHAGDDIGALVIYDDLCRFAIEGITDKELNTLATIDKVRLLGAAQGKLELIEAALGNAPGGGVEAPTETTPPPSIPASNTTTPEAPPLAG